MWQCVNHLTEWECSLSVKSLVPLQTDITSLKSNLSGQSRIFSGIFSVSCIRTMYAKLFINVDIYIRAPSPKIFTALLTAVILCNNFSSKYIKKNALDLGFIMQELNIYTLVNTFLNGDLFPSKFTSKHHNWFSSLDKSVRSDFIPAKSKNDWYFKIPEHCFLSSQCTQAIPRRYQRCPVFSRPLEYLLFFTNTLKLTRVMMAFWQTIAYISATALKVCSFCDCQMFQGKVPMFYWHEIYVLPHFSETKGHCSVGHRHLWSDFWRHNTRFSFKTSLGS